MAVEDMEGVVVPDSRRRGCDGSPSKSVRSSEDHASVRLICA